jgi:hypothetical protein
VVENLDWLSALVNFLSALACLFLMQKFTADCGLSTAMGRIKLIHRFAFVALAASLMYDAAISIADESAPRLVDFLVQVASFAVIALSAWRHHVGARDAQARLRVAHYGMGQAAVCGTPAVFPSDAVQKFGQFGIVPESQHSQEKMQ